MSSNATHLSGQHQRDNLLSDLLLLMQSTCCQKQNAQINARQATVRRALSDVALRQEKHTQKFDRMRNLLKQKGEVQ